MSNSFTKILASAHQSFTIHWDNVKGETHLRLKLMVNNPWLPNPDPESAVVAAVAANLIIAIIKVHSGGHYRIVGHDIEGIHSLYPSRSQTGRGWPQRHSEPAGKCNRLPRQVSCRTDGPRHL